MRDHSGPRPDSLAISLAISLSPTAFLSPPPRRVTGTDPLF